MGDGAGLDDQLAGAQVPPEIRVGDRPERHDEYTNEKKQREAGSQGEFHAMPFEPLDVP